MWLSISLRVRVSVRVSMSVSVSIRGRVSQDSGPACRRNTLAATVSHVAAIARPEGQQVDVPARSVADARNPCGPSFMLSAGIPSLGIGSMRPVYPIKPGMKPVPEPEIMDSFSLRVMLATNLAARVCGQTFSIDGIVIPNLIISAHRSVKMSSVRRDPIVAE